MRHKNSRLSICVIPMIILNNKFTYEMDFLLQLILCALFATIIEFIFGIVFNSDYHIWDYRNMPLNLFGMICLPFSFLWMFIAAIVIPLMDWIDCYIFNYKPETKPYYKIFGKKNMANEIKLMTEAVQFGLCLFL